MNIHSHQKYKVTDLSMQVTDVTKRHEYCHSKDGQKIFN